MVLLVAFATAAAATTPARATRGATARTAAAATRPAARAADTAAAVPRAAAAPALPALPEFIADTPVADPGDSGPLLTLGECEALVLQQHPARAAAQATVAAARAQAGMAHAADYPDVSLGGAYRRWESHAFMPAAISRSMTGGTIGPFDDFSAALKAGWLLCDFGQRANEQAAADARVRAAAAGTAVTDAQLLAGVRTGYYTLLAVQAARDAAWQRLGRANAHLLLAEQRKAAGAVPRADVMRAKVEVANARLAYVQRAGEVAVARADLNAALGRPAEMPLRVAAPATAAVTPVAAARDLALTQAAARPELRAAEEKVAAGRAALAAAQAAWRPKLRADASGGWRDDECAPEDEDWSVGVSFALPVFDGWLRDRQCDQAAAVLAQAEAERDRLALTVRQEICSAQAQCGTADEAAAASAVLAADARESLRLARERYAAGAGTINDLLDAQTNLAAAELAQAGAEFQRQITLAWWQRVTQVVP